MCIVIAGLVAAPAFAQNNNAFDSAIQAAQAVKNDSVRLHTLLQVYKNVKDISSRQDIRLNTLILADATALKNDTATIDAYIGLGHSNMLLSNYTQALDNYLNALKIAEKINDYENEAKAYEEIAWIYKLTGEINKTPADLDIATTYINKGLQITATHNLAATEISLLSDLAVIYDIRKMHNKAIETYKGAISRIGYKNRRRLINLYMNLGICYKNNKELDSALAVYKIAFNIADSLGLGMYKMFVIDNMANLYYETGQYVLSENMAQDAINQSFVNGVAAIRVDMYELLKKLYAKQGNYNSAFTYAEKLTIMKDSMFNIDKSAQLKDMQEKYETDIKDKQITAQQGQLTYNKQLNRILGAGVVAIFFIAGFIYLNLRKTAKLNRTVSLQRDELAKQSNTLSLMMKELHHRVKNNLQIVSSLLNLQSMRLSDEEAVNAVQESKQRVQAMSLIHQRLYKTDDITRINMKEYIKDLADFLAVSYGFGNDKFTLEMEVEEEWSDIDKALPVGLILNELLTNAFKYAFAGIAHPVIHISLKRDKENITLVIKDNGKGIAPGKWDDSVQAASFGKQLVKALCSQLRAKQKLEVNEGTSFTFIIPAAA